MKFVAQLATLFGVALSLSYCVFFEFNFASTTSLLSFTAAFAATFFFGNKNSMSQKTGNNSKAFQAGRDLNIKK